MLECPGEYDRAMKRDLFCALVAALIFVPACSAAQSTEAQPETAIRTSADLVVVDVVASDNHKNPVHQLNPSDFTILEDGKPQVLKVFEEHAAGAPSPLAPMPKLEPGTFTNYSPTPTHGALNILLFDKLNTPMRAQAYVRDQVLKYLKEARPGTRMAIFSLTLELKLLQGFTTDPELLRALVAGKKGNPGGSPLMDNQMEGDQPGADDAMMDAVTDALGNNPNASTITANLQEFEAEQQSFQLQLRARYTLDALNQLARYMSNLPGRKNLIWFSGSFPISILPDADLQDPFAVVATAEDEFRETVDLLARSQVAVYPIDARGLMTEPMLDASQSGSTMNRTPNGFAKANTKWFQNTANEQGTMQQMAEATGGRAFVNSNDLKQDVEKAIEAGSNYYTLAYTPANRNWNGSFRKIEVKLDRPGETLAYRRGYFADDLTKPAHHKEAQNERADAGQYNAMRAAMLRGGPEPTQLVFAAQVRPSTPDTEAAAAPGNQADKTATGPFHTYTVTFLVNPRQLSCAATPDGVHRCAMEFLTFVYDADGKRINTQTNGIAADFTAERYASLAKSNLSYRQQIGVPVKGEYFLRIGMHDLANDHVGAVELPVAAVAKMAPLPAANVATSDSNPPAATKQTAPAASTAPPK